MSTDVREQLLALLGDIAPDADLVGLDDDKDLRRVIDLDSLDFQTLVERVARETGIEIPEIDYPQVRTLRGLTEYIATRRG
jgi:acyl carrier protein